MAALGLVCAEVVMVSASGAILMSGSDLALRDVTTTGFFRADCFAILFAIGLWVSARLKNRETTMAMALLGSAADSGHGFDQPCCGAHRRSGSIGDSHCRTSLGYSRLAWRNALSVDLLGPHGKRGRGAGFNPTLLTDGVVGAATLVLAGVGMAWFYVGSWSGIYSTTYGIMLVAKICLLLAMVGSAPEIGSWCGVWPAILNLCWRGCAGSSRRRLLWDFSQC